MTSPKDKPVMDERVGDEDLGSSCDLSRAGGVKLDTSGFIDIPASAGEPKWDVRWFDLDPFTQGYIEAAFASLDRDFMGEPRLRAPQLDAPGVTSYVNVGFSSLAPEALAAIIADCADPARHHDDGKQFWAARQGRWLMYAGRDALIERFPPLTLTLSDDGKVRLS